MSQTPKEGSIDVIVNMGWVRRPVLAGWLLLLCLMTGTSVACAQTTSKTALTVDTPFMFDIASRELGDALDVYSQLTGAAIIIDSAHARQMSGAVTGGYGARDALQQLLKGTGLQARYTDRQSIVIEPIPALPLALANAGGQSAVSGVASVNADVMRYAGIVQTQLHQALCREPETVPGSYRLAIQLYFGADGKVTRWHMLDTTGVSSRDAAINRLVATLDTHQAPPAMMAQPVVMLLLPDSATLKTDCTPHADDGRPYAVTRH